MENNVFTGVRAKWESLYHELFKLVENKVGKFNIKHTSNSILWKHTSTFAEIRAKKDSLIVAFSSDKLHDDWATVKTLQTSKHRVAHYFEVVDSGELPLLADRIKEAFYLTDPNKPAKKKDDTPEYNTVNEYISIFPAEVQKILKNIRSTIKKSAPEAEEKISWQMPTYHLKENLVHFAGFKNHIGFYPGDEAVKVFDSKLADYKHSKGSIQFPLNQEIPYDLVREITEWRVDLVKGK